MVQGVLRRAIVGVGLLMAGAVHAQEAPGVVAPDPAQGPGFVNLQRFDATSRGGIDVTYFVLDSDADVTFVRLEGHVQYVDPASRLGGYAQIPLAFATGDNDSESVLGNLEVGGIYLPRLSSPSLALVLHAGVALPTARDEQAGELGIIGGYLRPHDLYQTLPRATTLRVGVSPLWRSGQVFARLDAGLDINVLRSSEAGDTDTVDPGLHVNVGLGLLVAPTTSIALELSTMTIMDDNDSESLNTAALTFRHDTGTVQPYGALVLPLDDEVNDIIKVGITVGVEARL